MVNIISSHQLPEDLLKDLQKEPPHPKSGRMTFPHQLAARTSHAVDSGGGFSGIDLERIIQGNELLPVNYLSRGVLAADAVCRISVSEEIGGSGKWGTGFMITPDLLLTNHHVISSIQEAERSTIEFRHERGSDGRFRDSQHFSLDPDATFKTSATEQLDYTIVAVKPSSDDGTTSITEFGFLRLASSTHKISQNEFVSIIQHPDGKEKHVSLRENRVLKIGAAAGDRENIFLWYATDTAPGASGAPVFNDQWQVVALHHRGVPETRTTLAGAVEYQRTDGTWVNEEQVRHLRDDELVWLANEGIRVSALVADIRAQQGHQPSPLIRQMLDDIDGVKPLSGHADSRASIVHQSIPEQTAPPPTLERFTPSGRTHPANYFSGRRGYDPNFLGIPLALPTLTEQAMKFGPIATVLGRTDGVLCYEHFSVVLSASRRLAFFTAVNIDGNQSSSSGKGDAWYYDARVPATCQIGDELYGNEPVGNYFDRGHLVRRLDPVWGDSATAARANSDTFHWTNCSPQYWRFNQGNELWQGLENYILSNTDQDNLKASVFTGPVFREDDRIHRGIGIPQSFWKLVAVVDGAGRLYTSAYVVSQKAYATDIPFEQLPIGDVNHFQVSVARLESLTGLSFGDTIGAADVRAGRPEQPLRGLSDIQHPRRSRSPQAGFGQFASLEDFLLAYEQSRAEDDARALTISDPVLLMEARRQRRQRDIVEVSAKVAQYLGINSSGNDRHQHVLLTLSEILQGDPDVASDMTRVIQQQERVFLSIRFGDRMGLSSPVPGLNPGADLRLRGEWIPRDRAYAHGGERMSVLHFTHHPVGHVCVAQQCWE